MQGRDARPQQLKAHGSQLQTELDALRGLMLILMTLAHLPNQARLGTNQQLGFASEAEWFVFLSAFWTGRIFVRVAHKYGFPTVIKRLWTRALRLYGIAFTVVALVAIHTKRPSLKGFAALPFVGNGTGSPAWIQPALIGTTLIGRYWVARLFVNSRTGAAADYGVAASGTLSIALWLR
jgi:hypothetical protein